MMASVKQQETHLSVLNPTIGLSFTETRKVFEALAFAAHKHRDQRRKDEGASPYINHPIALANILVNEGGVTDHVVLCAAILHDTIEDTETTYDELLATFGREIADVVAEVTDDTTLLREERKRRQVTSAPTKSYEAKLCKLADKICNLRDLRDCPPDWSAERIDNYHRFARDVYRGLKGAHAALDNQMDQLLAQHVQAGDKLCTFD